MDFEDKIRKLDRKEEVDLTRQYKVPYPINLSEKHLLELNKLPPEIDREREKFFFPDKESLPEQDQLVPGIEDDHHSLIAGYYRERDMLFKRSPAEIEALDNWLKIKPPPDDAS